MEPVSDPESVHPQGELPAAAQGAWPIDTPGGRFYTEWDPSTPVSVHGQLAFLAQFLHAGKRWDALLNDCPLQYTGNRGSGARI